MRESEFSITIVIPAFNVEKFLGDALRSIENQTRWPDELILIDDGSWDGTLEIANSFSFPFPYSVISIRNQGPGNARNIGLNLASSKYIYFFDADDLLVNDFVDSVKNHVALKEFPDIVFFSGESFNDSDYKGDRWIEYSRGFSGDFKRRSDFLDEAHLHDALFCSPCMYLSKKTVWKDNKLEFGEYYFEDEEVFFPLIFSCDYFSVTNKVLFLRRNREGSTMTIKPNMKHVLGTLTCIDSTLKLCRSSEFHAREYWYLKERLRQHLTSYVVNARSAGCSLSFRKIWEVIYATGSIKLLIIVLLYILRVDRWKIAKKIAKKIRNFRKC